MRHFYFDIIHCVVGLWKRLLLDWITTYDVTYLIQTWPKIKDVILHMWTPPPPPKTHDWLYPFPNNQFINIVSHSSTLICHPANWFSKVYRPNPSSHQERRDKNLILLSQSYFFDGFPYRLLISKPGRFWIGTYFQKLRKTLAVHVLDSIQ